MKMAARCNGRMMWNAESQSTTEFCVVEFPNPEIRMIRILTHSISSRPYIPGAALF